MKIYIVIIAFVFSNASSACEYIDGKWHSNKEMSMRFNNSHAAIDTKTTSLLKQILGHLAVEINGTQYHQLYSPAVTVEIDGKEYLHSYDEMLNKITFKECTEDTVTFIHPVHGVSTVHFEGPNIFWTSPFGSWREYFARLQQTFT